MSFTTVVSFFLYGILVAILSPKLVRAISFPRIYGEHMNWAIAMMVLYFVHYVVFVAKPAVMNSSPNFTALSHAGGLQAKAGALRSKFKGSDTMLLNSISMVQ